MTTVLPQVPTIDALAEALGSVADLAAEIRASAWDAPTACPGWRVRDQLAHVIGTESMLAGVEPPPSDVDVRALPHVANDIAAFNEAWIVGLAGTGPDELVARLRSVTATRLATLRAMDAASWEAEGFTPAGPDSHGRFMRIRTFDTWMHEQDIRQAVHRPGHLTGPVVELVLDEIATALGFVVGKKAGLPDGASVTFDLTGTDHHELNVLVDGRARVVDGLPGPATVVLRLPLLTFTRLAGGRVAVAAVRDQVTIEGDQHLGEAVLANLAFTI